MRNIETSERKFRPEEHMSEFDYPMRHPKGTVYVEHWPSLYVSLLFDKDETAAYSELLPCFDVAICMHT